MPAFHPTVVTIARILAGTTDNVIPETAEILGTIRSFSEDTRRRVRVRSCRRTIVFMSVTAEEKGLLGSEYYASAPLYPLATTVASLNMDGVGPNGLATTC